MKYKKGAGGFLTIALVLIVVVALALYLFNFVFNQPPQTPSATAPKITNSEQASEKTADVGKTLQDVSSTIEDIERKIG